MAGEVPHDSFELLELFPDAANYAQAGELDGLHQRLMRLVVSRQPSSTHRFCFSRLWYRGPTGVHRTQS